MESQCVLHRIFSRKSSADFVDIDHDICTKRRFCLLLGQKRFTMWNREPFYPHQEEIYAYQSAFFVPQRNPKHPAHFSCYRGTGKAHKRYFAAKPKCRNRACQKHRPPHAYQPCGAGLCGAGQLFCPLSPYIKDVRAWQRRCERYGYSCGRPPASG